MSPTPIDSHAYAGREDLQAMASIVTAAWARSDHALVHCTVGDLEWWLASGGADADWSSRIRIWTIGGDPAGWGWLSPPSSLDSFIRAGLPDADAVVIRDEIDAWHAERARTFAAAPSADPGTSVASADAPERVLLDQWAVDGSPDAVRLLARGWTPTDTILTQYGQSLDLELDPPRVPDGYVLRSLRGPADIPARVEVHRAAFAPSRMTVEKYAILVDQHHYAFDRDVVLEAADGSFAAFAMCWMDPAGSVGEFEPVGTHPDHQRRGLGRVILRHGLRLMRAAGLREALVFSLRSNAASEALYRAAGFDERALHRRWQTPLDR